MPPRRAMLALVAGSLVLAAAVVATPSARSASVLQSWILTGTELAAGAFEGTMFTGNALRLTPRLPVTNRSVVLDVGAPGAADSIAAYLPFVLRETDGSYKMWYTGSNGSHLSILLATSLDGLQWVKQGPVLSVADGAETPFVLRIGSVYHMWFTEVTWGGSPIGYLDQIYHATSPDGVAWTIQGLAMGVGPAHSWSGDTVSEPWIVRASTGPYFMYYSGWNDTADVQIGVATSWDLLNWTSWVGNPIVHWDSPSSWDAADVSSASVFAGSPWIMYFGGRQNGTPNQIGAATSTDGYNWTKDAGNPVIGPEAAPAWDDVDVSSPDLFLDPLGLRMYYAGGDGSASRIGVYFFGPLPRIVYQGNYTSPVFDSGSNGTTWHAVSANATEPSGTSIRLKVRVGNDSVPNTTWSRWTDSVNASALRRTRYAQLEGDFESTSWNLTPSVTSFTLTYARNMPPSVISWSPPPGGWSNGQRPTFRWNMTDGENDSIVAERVELSSMPSFSVIALDSGNLSPGTTSWQVPYDLAQGVWFWRVQANDSYGAWSTWSSSELGIDIGPPLLSVSDPTPGVLLHSSTVNVQWLAADTLSGVSHIDVSLDGKSAAFVGGGNSSTVLSGVADGAHLLRVTAFDQAGNAATVTLSFGVDTGVFSPTGPYGAVPLALLIAAVVVVSAIVALLWFRRRKQPPHTEQRPLSPGP